ncbi:MAG: polymer-forming cytoskeletal protein [Flavobacteriia bacterium]|nr:MAG: polymer-forming cytoskeletal protein [Flavobacteriia bacterium]
MFNEKKGTTQPLSEINIIGKNTVLTGDISSDGDFRIDGKIEGNIKSKGKVIIGKDGFVKGTIECINADIEGAFSGKLIVDQLLSLKETANITGDVVLEKLSVEPGAEFNATCSMKGAVKNINKDGAKAKKTA